jgi:hypothetical protein
MMVAVLLRLKASGMLDEYRNLSAYVARGPPSSVLSTLNWRFSLASHRPADKGPLWVRVQPLAIALATRGAWESHNLFL